MNNNIDDKIVTSIMKLAYSISIPPNNVTVESIQHLVYSLIRIIRIIYKNIFYYFLSTFSPKQYRSISLRARLFPELFGPTRIVMLQGEISK